MDLTPDQRRRLKMISRLQPLELKASVKSKKVKQFLQLRMTDAQLIKEQCQKNITNRIIKENINPKNKKEVQIKKKRKRYQSNAQIEPINKLIKNQYQKSVKLIRVCERLKPKLITSRTIDGILCRSQKEYKKLLKQQFPKLHNF